MLTRRNVHTESFWALENFAPYVAYGDTEGITVDEEQAFEDEQRRLKADAPQGLTFGHITIDPSEVDDFRECDVTGTMGKCSLFHAVYLGPETAIGPSWGEPVTLSDGTHISLFVSPVAAPEAGRKWVGYCIQHGQNIYHGQDLGVPLGTPPGEAMGSLLDFLYAAMVQEDCKALFPEWLMQELDPSAVEEALYRYLGEDNDISE